MDINIPEVAPGDAWARLENDAVAQLIDVRTPAEWSFSGHPNLEPIGKSVVFAQWSSFPEHETDPHYAVRLENALVEAGLNKETPLFFLCRSGVRSLAAAKAMAARGFTQCHNVTDGFEGPPDAKRRRGNISGWKASGLDWMQS